MTASWLQPLPASSAAEPAAADLSGSVPSTPGRRWKFYNSFMDKTLCQLHPSEAVVWLDLFRHANGEGIVTRSQRLIIKATGLSRSAVERAIRRLKEDKLVNVTNRGNNLKQQASQYRLRALIREDKSAPSS